MNIQNSVAIHCKTSSTARGFLANSTGKNTESCKRFVERTETSFLPNLTDNRTTGPFQYKMRCCITPQTSEMLIIKAKLCDKTYMELVERAGFNMVVLISHSIVRLVCAYGASIPGKITLPAYFP